MPISPSPVAMTATAKLDRPYLIGLGRTPGTVLYAAPEGDTWKWQETDLDGPATPLLEMGQEQRTIRAPRDDLLIGYVRRKGDEITYTFFDPADARNWRGVQAAFPGDRVSLESWSDDRRKIEYRLTEKGMDLLPAMLALRQWGEKYAGSGISNPVLVDSRDWQPIGPVAILAGDGRVLDYHELRWQERSKLGENGDLAKCKAEEPNL